MGQFLIFVRRHWHAVLALFFYVAIMARRIFFTTCNVDRCRPCSRGSDEEEVVIVLNRKTFVPLLINMTEPTVVDPLPRTG